MFRIAKNPVANTRLPYIISMPVDEGGQVFLAVADKWPGAKDVFCLQLTEWPENAEVLERSVFLNSLLLRKGISWTQIFADLEEVLPYNVRVIQIRPIVDAQNQVTLDMQVGSESPAPVIELLKTMAREPFGSPQLALQQAPTQAEPLYRYRMSVNYAQKL
jgi:hypothetical protein